MPNIRMKLPSRNWSIFFAVVGTFTSLVVYDREQKKKVQAKWCRMVSHVADEPLDTRTMPRKVTVYLAAPPGDGLRASREHFNDYVKPILVAGAMDWELVEGRRQGQVRAKLAERIRRLRRRAGEVPEGDLVDDEGPSVEDVVEDVRRQSGVRRWPGPTGDIVVGRHTWREYVRGLHEGLLGPLRRPPEPVLALSDLDPSKDPSDSQPASSDMSQQPSGSRYDQSPGLDAPQALSSSPGDEPASSEGPSGDMTPKTPQPEAAETPPSPAKPTVPAPFIDAVAYASATPSSSFPEALEPAAPIPFPHILGFLNTPVRIYRFLTRRYVADDVGRRTAAVVLAEAVQPWESHPNADAAAGAGFAHTLDTESSSTTVQSPSASLSTSPSSSPSLSSSSSPSASAAGQIRDELLDEEKDWGKRADLAHNNKKSDDKNDNDDKQTEHVWIDDVVVDPRIAQRMRRFVAVRAE